MVRTKILKRKSKWRKISLPSKTIQVSPNTGSHLFQSPSLNSGERKKTFYLWVGERTACACPSRLHSVALGQTNQHVYLLIQLSSFQSVMYLKGNELFKMKLIKIRKFLDFVLANLVIKFFVYDDPKLQN